MRSAIRLALVAAVLVLGACATIDDDDDAAPPPRPPDAQPGERPEPSSEAMPAAVLELVSAAERDSSAGRHDRAAAQLERALRVAPRNPVLWQNLAVVRYRQDQLEEAIAMAERSNDLAGPDARLRRDNWRLIGVARELLGDTEGAARARERAGNLQGGP